MVRRLRSTNLRESRVRLYKGLDGPAVPLSVEAADGFSVGLLVTVLLRLISIVPYDSTGSNSGGDGSGRSRRRVSRRNSGSPPGRCIASHHSVRPTVDGPAGRTGAILHDLRSCVSHQTAGHRDVHALAGAKREASAGYADPEDLS